MNTPPVAGRSNQPLGAGRDQRRRFLWHHLPIGLASAVVLVLFTRLPVFDVNQRPHGAGPTRALPQMRHEDHARTISLAGNHSQRFAVDGDHLGAGNHSFVRQFSVATGYVALGLLAMTLLVGPANLLLNRRNPLSSYLRRDVGMWTAVASVVHTVVGFQVHSAGTISGFLSYFVAPDGGVLLDSFGLANWTGLAAIVITTGLLAISSDAALRTLKAGRWKSIQRLNYAVFALVILHALFYGALSRGTSPFELLLELSVLAVLAGQVMGVWLWRRKRVTVQPS